MKRKCQRNVGMKKGGMKNEDMKYMKNLKVLTFGQHEEGMKQTAEQE